MKKFIFFFLSLCLMAGSITAQKGFKLDRDETGEVIEDIDFGFPWPTTGKKFPGPIMKKFHANKSMIMNHFDLSEKQFNSIASQVLKEMKGKSAKQLKMMHRSQMRKANSDVKFLMETIKEEYHDDNANVQAQQSGAKDILDTGASGAAVGAAFGAGLGLVFGPEGAVAGGAIGGALGAAFGTGLGVGQEIGEELGLATEDN